MSLQVDYAEISRQARRIVDANRARIVVEQQQHRSDEVQPRRKRVKFARSTTGCYGCRQQKVKCDETKDSCLRCIAAQRKCEYPPKKQSVPPADLQMSSTTSSASPPHIPPSTDVLTTIPSLPQAMSALPGFPQVSLQNGSGPTIVGGAGGTINLESLFVNPAAMVPSTGALDMDPFGVGLGTGPASDINTMTSLDWTTWQPPAAIPTEPAKAPESSALSASSGFTPDFSALHEWLTFTSPPTIPAISVSPSSILPAETLAITSETHTTKSPPQFQNLSKSTLLNRRNAGKSSGQIFTAPLPSIPQNSAPLSGSSKIAMADSILQASALDDTFIEWGPSLRRRSIVNNSKTHTDALTSAFPSITARSLFHHYCNVTSRLLITMGDIGPNPLLTLCSPMTLLDTASATSAAIRMSILSISTAHFAHETSPDPVDGMEDAFSEVLELTKEWSGRKASLRKVSAKLKKAALSNITLATAKSLSPQEIDGILAAYTLLCIRDVVSADSMWEENLEFAMKLVHKLGGPQQLLSGTEYTFARRYFLENLAAHDVFGCFITGKEPVLLGNFDRWWFESVEKSHTRWEWESVERTFGISRAMVDLVARVVTLDSRKRRLDIAISDPDQDMVDLCQHFVAESHTLLLEADLWGVSLSCLPQNVRVTCGDHIYKHMIVLFILADILEQAPTTARVAKSVECILELCCEATAMLFALPESRPTVTSLFDAFQYDYFDDLINARSCLEEQWRLIDMGKKKQSWSDVMKSIGKYSLVL